MTTENESFEAYMNPKKPQPPVHTFDAKQLMTDTERLVWLFAFVQAAREGKGERKCSGSAFHTMRTFRENQARVHADSDPSDPADILALQVDRD